MDRVTRSLAEALVKERHKAMEYTFLTVLCTPAFVGAGALFVAVVAADVIFRTPQRSNLDAITFYTAVSAFLAYMVAGTMRNASSRAEGMGFDLMWVTGVVLFLGLLILTFATSLPQQHPLLFGATYALVGFVILGFVGQTLPPDYTLKNDDPMSERIALVLAIPSMVTSAYRELLSASWLWRPPRPGEVRNAAMVLCRLATNQDRPLDCGLVEERITMLLSRLQMIRVEDQHLYLSPQGLEFTRAALQDRSD